MCFFRFVILPVCLVIQSEAKDLEGILLGESPCGEETNFCIDKYIVF